MFFLLQEKVLKAFYLAQQKQFSFFWKLCHFSSAVFCYIIIYLAYLSQYVYFCIINWECKKDDFKYQELNMVYFLFFFYSYITKIQVESYLCFIWKSCDFRSVIDIRNAQPKLEPI